MTTSAAYAMAMTTPGAYAPSHTSLDGMAQGATPKGTTTQNRTVNLTTTKLDTTSHRQPHGLEGPPEAGSMTAGEDAGEAPPSTTDTPHTKLQPLTPKDQKPHTYVSTEYPGPQPKRTVPPKH